MNGTKILMWCKSRQSLKKTKRCNRGVPFRPFFLPQTMVRDAKRDLQEGHVWSGQGEVCPTVGSFALPAPRYRLKK